MAKEPKKGPLGAPDNPVSVAQVPPGGVTGRSIDEELGGPTPAQRAGLAPYDAEADQEEAEHRQERPNLQTSHEAANSLDAVSGGPSPGITEDTPLTGKQQGQQPTDMSGRPPMKLSDGDKEIFPRIREALSKARAEDNKSKDKPEELRGFRTPMEMGIPGGVVARILDATDPDQERVERSVVPSGHFFPETGTRYRMK